MATVRPFKALRADKENVAKVTAPPYDVINSEEARLLAQGNEVSLLHITKPEIDLDPKIDLYDEKVYEKARENMNRFVSEGVLFQDEKPMFYLYRQTMPLGEGFHSQLGLVAAVSVDEYQQDMIKTHELTRKDKEDDRTKHVYVTQANTGPVFLTYKPSRNIDALFAELEKKNTEYDFTGEDGIRHMFWLIDNDGDIGKIEEEFRAIPVMYVADGHHRSASAMRVREMMKLSNEKHTGDEEYNFFLAVVFPSDQMHIMAYNRIVKNLNGLGIDAFFKKVGEKFEITPAGDEVPTPQRKHEFGMYIDHKGYILKPLQGTYDEADPVLSLDVSILQNNLLAPILGIQDPRSDKNIDFVGGIRGNGELKKHVDSGSFKVAFSMYPTSIDDLIDVSDAGKIMPPKSTWFEPKLKDGMAIHTLND